jgi:hypothetical protein
MYQQANGAGIKRTRSRARPAGALISPERRPFSLIRWPMQLCTCNLKLDGQLGAHLARHRASAPMASYRHAGQAAALGSYPT